MRGFSFALDWMRFTLEHKSDNPPEDYFPPDGSLWKPCAPYGSYNESVSNEFCTMLWHTNHPEFRVMFDFTGVNLSDWRNAGHTDRELVEWVVSEGGKATRVDFAVDFVETKGRVQDFSVYWRTKQLETMARSMTFIDGQSTEGATGYTVYLGSRTSERMVRVYHKGMQSKTGMDWIRCELEWKKARATQMIDDMHRLGVREAGLSHLREFIPYTAFKWFEQCFEDGVDLFPVDKIARPETDTERWLRTVCVPALAQALKNGVPGIREALEGILKDEQSRSEHGPRLLPHD